MTEKAIGRRVPHVVDLLGCVLLVLLAACDGKVPVPSVPQLQEVGEIGEYGTSRLSAADACRQQERHVAAYVSCMEQSGWTFIARGTTYPAPECWSRRAAGDPGDLPPSMCFQRSAADTSAN